MVKISYLLTFSFAFVFVSIVICDNQVANYKLCQLIKTDLEEEGFLTRQMKCKYSVKYTNAPRVSFSLPFIVGFYGTF